MSNATPLGVTEEQIAAAEAELGIRFPDRLREVWKTYNCNELPGGWRVYPVFDPANPRKTAGSITYENLRGAWGRRVMTLGLISIASNGTGNQLVLKVEEGQAGAEIFFWQHDTQKLKAWKPGFDSIAGRAAKAREAVQRLQQTFGRREH
ncbi:SMI1/KNR4 family protein [Variovorax sp. ZS18.2.2]|uniref:SMI1/KNR4 family protein n=1 Tax=Variovorax sp. ZS18.2.2 TaxID=2971255 RepID=UPI002150740F|nr:SMI1/KNR4 family protein [Variovorax sp. ZS18.2.2]MCR6477785.1 SMI1/KNR4 family protein [Variovorax sp. ZS18.2.2]